MSRRLRRYYRITWLLISICWLSAGSPLTAQVQRQAATSAQEQTLRPDTKEEALNRQRNLFLFGILFVLVLVLAVIYIIHKGFVERQKVSVLIDAKNEMLEELNQEISLKNEEITMQNESLSMQRELLIQANEDLESKHHALEELYRDQNSLMSVVAHDLKSPLDQIDGVLQLLPLDGDLNTNQKQHIKRLLSISSNAKKLINNLLYVNRLDEQETHAAPETVYLNDFLQALVKRFEEVAQSKQISISLEAIDKGTVLQVVRDYLSRVLENLLSNAIKFSPQGSTVSLKITYEHDWLILSVLDQGPGFAEEDKERLFKKFQTLSARPTAGESSSGLGLYIVQRLVKRMQGRIELTSMVGEGAHFMLFLPYGQRLEGSATPVSLKTKSMKILS